jgi:molybdenum cofactor biosynthesis enzyme MoaA
MPKEVFGPGHAFLRDPQLMSLGELTRIARAFISLGVEKIRLTGGEPLLRPDVPDLVAALKHDLRLPDVALTTNGWLLEKLAPALRTAGLDRINVSIDSLDPERFAAIVPICGGGQYRDILSATRTQKAALLSLGIWVHHGAKDPTVPLSESETMVAALKKAGVTDLDFTIYPEAKHDSWTETYNNPELYTWLL